MSDYDKVLIGRSTPIMEINDEEGYLNFNLLTNAEIDADFIAIINYLGTEEFKSLYLNLYNEIKSLSLERQRELCQHLIIKVREIYSFEFTPMLTFDIFNDIDKFLKFIEFIEYDYIWFLAIILQGMDFKLLKKNLDLFLTQNWNKIYDKIETMNINNELISKFLRTNNKENVFKFIRERIEKNKMLVILKIMEGEMKSEWYNNYKKG